MSTFKVMIIGCGHWGPNYVRTFKNLADTEVVACCDLSDKNLEKISLLYPGIKAYKDYKKALDENKCDIAVVATPASTHYPIIMELLKRDINVLAEKPLTVTTKDSEKIIEYASKKKAKLMVALTFLFNSSVRKAYEIVHDKSFGQIYYIKAVRTHLGLIREDVNAVFDLAPHDISIFNYILGAAPLSVSAIGGSYLKKDREDVSFINLEYPGGIIGNINVSWIDSHKVREVAIVGGKRRVFFNDLDNLEPIRIYEKGISVEKPYYNDFGEFKLMLRDGDILSPKVELTEPLKVQCRHFVDCVRDNKTPLSDAKSSLDVVKVLNAINKSMRSSGKPVKIS